MPSPPSVTISLGSVRNRVLVVFYMLEGLMA